MAYRDLFKRNTRTTNVNMADNGGKGKPKYNYNPKGKMVNKNATDTNTGKRFNVNTYPSYAVYNRGLFKNPDGTYSSDKMIGIRDENGDIVYGNGVDTSNPYSPSRSSGNGGGNGYGSQLAAINSALKAQIGEYNLQKDQVNQDYDKLVNQSELSRYKTRASIREALANRGQLDSGLGRQEQLYVDTQYGNALNDINLQRANQIQNINNLIAQARATAKAKKARYR